MEATPSKVMQFFSGFKQSVIPLFQRAYEWKKENWETLWSDTMERYEAANDVDHFLGAIVTSPAKSVPVGVSKFLVIDGQQRLTTLALLLCAIRDELPAESKSRNRIQKHYLLNEDYDGWDNLKLLPTQVDRASFLALARGQADVPPSRMREAYEYFRARIREVDSDGQPIDAQRLLETIESRLMVVSINLGDNDDPYLIFESLNFKGAPLTQADLVRNYFLMKFPLADQQAIFDAAWLPMQQRLGDHLTEFMRVYLMQGGDEVQRGEIYREIKRRLQDLDPSQARAELERMHDLSKSYLVLVKPEHESNPKVRARLEAAKSLEVATSHPLLLKVFDRYRRGDISVDEIDKFIGVIESFAVRRFFVEVPTNQLKKIYLGLAKAYDGQPPAEWLADQQAAGQFGKRWPKDDEFEAAWKRFPVYLRRERCRLILEMLERHHGHKEQAALSNATIEHVMPQSLTDWWNEHLGADAVAFEEILHTIGNLTLTGYNAELSNQSLPEKVVLLADSHYSLNGYFQHVLSWRKSDIQQRSEALFARALQLWPRPN